VERGCDGEPRPAGVTGIERNGKKWKKWLGGWLWELLAMGNRISLRRGRTRKLPVGGAGKTKLELGGLEASKTWKLDSGLPSSSGFEHKNYPGV